MGAKIIEMPAREAVKDLTIKVRLTGAAAFGVRVKIGAALFALGAAIMGIGFEIETNPRKVEPPNDRIGDKLKKRK